MLAHEMGKAIDASDAWEAAARHLPADRSRTGTGGTRRPQIVHETI